MSRLQLLILWILALGAGIFYFNNKDVPDTTTSKTKLEVGDSLISNSTINTIDGLKISAEGKTTTLKKVDQRWTVVEKGNFPADVNIVSRLLNNLSDTKVAQGVPASAEYYDRFNLDPAVEDADEKPENIILSKEGEPDIEVYLGKSRESTGGSRGGAGRFVRLGSDDSGVYVTQQAFNGLLADPGMWIVKTLALVEEGPLKIEVTAPGDANFKPWSVSRASTADKLLLDGLNENEETRITETGQLNRLFTSFSELLTAEEAKERSAESGTREVKITDSSGSSFLFTLTPEKVVIPEDAPKDAPPSTEPSNYIVSFKVLNGPVRPEAPAEDAALDKKAEFEARLENMGDIAISVENNKKTYEGRYLLMAKTALGSLIKNRADFVQEKKKEKPKSVVTTPPVAVPTSKGPPPGIARPTEKKRIEAVTPPIAVPPAEPKKPKAPNQTPPPLPGSKPSDINTPETPKQQEPKDEPKEQPKDQPEEDPKAPE